MFISNGDYAFPFSPLLFWLKHLFVWSFQTGAPNPDGIIRLPGRLIHLLVFQFGGNITMGYFYAAVSLLIVFFCFVYFGRRFLQVKSWPTLLVVALLFTINPIFLGNLAKVGLVMAAALLPLSLAFLRQLFVTRQLRYLLLYAIALNLSLLHPYTFTVNLLVSGGYALYLSWRHWPFIRQNALKILGIGAAVVAMNVYFLLPIMALGSISKDILSQEISDSPVDYTMLVDIANTGGLANAFLFGKQAFKDFEYASPAYLPVYVLGVLLLYGVLLGLFVKVYKRLSVRVRYWVIGGFAGLLLLILLSTGTVFNIDAVIKFLISQPGGWTFRSPLKWQLYIPFFVGLLLLLLFKYIPKGWLKRGALACVGASIIFMNGYLLGSVYTRLLVPKTVGEFATLQAANLEGKTLLFANTEACTFYAQEQPAVFTEMNQVLLSKNMQVKRILADKLTSIGLSSYDYVLSCQQSAASVLDDSEDFAYVASFADGAIELYQNQAPTAGAYATTDIFALSQFMHVGTKQSLVASELEKDFHFIDESDDRPSIGLYDAFDTLTPKVLKEGSVVTTVIPNNTGEQRLLTPEPEDLYFKKEDTRITLSPSPQKDFLPMERDFKFQAAAGRSLEFRYADPAFDYKNLVPNSSLEDGLWQEKVADCNAYDEHALITMKVDKKDKTDGRQSLRLEAERHIACTGPNDITVTPGARYLLSFDYKSTHPKKAGYYLGFNNASGDFVTERMVSTHETWDQYNHIIAVPPGATQMTVLFYAFPDEATADNVTTHYDNIQLIKIPDLQDRFYVVSSPNLNYELPQEVTMTPVDPTRKKIRISSAATPFYLVLKESYHPKWRLSLSNEKVNGAAGSWLPLGADAVSDLDHFKVNNAVNAWFVDPADLCRGNSGCIQNGDGSYDLELVAEFVPQRWLHVGLIISAAAWLGVIGYLGYDAVNRWRQKRQARGL